MQIDSSIKMQLKYSHDQWLLDVLKRIKVYELRKKHDNMQIKLRGNNNGLSNEM